MGPNTDGVKLKTRERLCKFSKLRGQLRNHGSQFWDYVVISAIDNAQKHSYEAQLKTKTDRNELPLTARYIVISDPPGPKIGNGGSTLFIIDQLAKKFGTEVLDKKTIIIHAGGFSQRLPNASVLGKVFLGVPVGNPMYQSLELKLASYIDFPQKMTLGGVFVSSADSLEVYDDCDIPWAFPSEGFTALAHMSTMSVGETHGVFVLDHPLSEDSLIWNCRKFLHKPTAQEMTVTPNCIVHVEKDKRVMTDSAFFISKTAALKLLTFYRKAAPLSCEVDAYGDFLQALGTESSPHYTKNVKNVCQETATLVKTRLQIYELLKDTPLNAVVLSDLPTLSPRKPLNKPIDSIFYHLGTMPEYQYHFCCDEALRSIVGVSPLISCRGIPYSFKTKGDGGSVTKVTKQGTLLCSIKNQAQYSTPCIMGSVLQSNVSVGNGSVIEYCHLEQGVSIGRNCILSNCHVPEQTAIQDGVFMYGSAITVSGRQLYVTVVFECGVDLKRTFTVDADNSVTHFGRPLGLVASFPSFVKNVGLWNAKLFPAAESMKKSCKQACEMLRTSKDEKNTPLLGTEQLYSMEDILVLKDIEATLDFRESLAYCISGAALASPFL